MVGAKTPLSCWLVMRYPTPIHLGSTGEVPRSGFAQSEEKDFTVLPGTTQYKEGHSENRLITVLHSDGKRQQKKLRHRRGKAFSLWDWPNPVTGCPERQILQTRQDVSELHNVIWLSCALRSYRLPPFLIPVFSIPGRDDPDCKAEASTVLLFVRAEFLHCLSLYKQKER